MKESATVRLIRWKGNEYRYDQADTDFVHEIMAHQLGIKKATLFMTVQTGISSHRCVILDIGDMDPEHPASADRLYELQQAAEQDPDRLCFMVELSRDVYTKLKKDRTRAKNNVFDLHMGYYDNPEENEPA